MSKTIGYLRGVHVLVATPDNLAEVQRFPEFKSIFDDLKAIAIDEVDACFKVRDSILPKRPIICILNAVCQSFP